MSFLVSARTPGYMSQTSSAQAADLANITLDQDTKDLDAFLEADSGKVSTPEQPEPTKGTFGADKQIYVSLL